jgi:hypothetical protein
MAQALPSGVNHVQREGPLLGDTGMTGSLTYFLSEARCFRQAPAFRSTLPEPSTASSTVCSLVTGGRAQEICFNQQLRHGGDGCDIVPRESLS